ncbi:hypothetical protein BDR05DRAFT_950556 [Suillus weaverae]|nr:hypothetical protein BDR05DRAFT_950556 [Suillus weaverae]
MRLSPAMVLAIVAALASSISATPIDADAEQCWIFCLTDKRCNACSEPSYCAWYKICTENIGGVGVIFVRLRNVRYDVKTVIQERADWSTQAGPVDRTIINRRNFYCVHLFQVISEGGYRVSGKVLRMTYHTHHVDEHELWRRMCAWVYWMGRALCQGNTIPVGGILCELCARFGLGLGVERGGEDTIGRGGGARLDPDPNLDFNFDPNTTRNGLKIVRGGSANWWVSGLGVGGNEKGEMGLLSSDELKECN